MLSPYACCKHIFIVFALLITMTGCEDFFISEVDNVKIPGSEPQLVVNSYISPQDTLIKVYVHRSRPHGMTHVEVSPVNENAEVYMAPKGGEFKKLSYDFNLRAFIIPATEFPVAPGKDYQLKVETPNGESVEAECHVPEHAVEDVSFVDLRVVYDTWGGMEVLIGWSVKPLKTAETNYFRTGGFVRSYRVRNYGDNDTIYAGSQDLWLDRGNELFSDAAGARYNFRGEFFGWIDIDGTQGQDEYYQNIDSVFVTVIQSDFSYFRFHQSVENYFYYDDDFPFAEPVHIYSNIKGGLGAFGGYSRRDYLLRVFPPAN